MHRALSVAVGTILSLIDRSIISLANETRTYGDLCDHASGRRVGRRNRIQAAADKPRERIEASCAPCVAAN